MSLPPIYLTVEGVIGVGKTTLATLLQPTFDARLMLEQFEDNPFLAAFYDEPERYAFQTQVVFLLSRYRQQREITALAGRLPLITDYLFAKDRLFARLNLAGPSWETYVELHNALAEQIAMPDLVIYLRASVDTLMDRIAQRGRSYEQTMSRDYITRLSAAYDDYFARYEPDHLLVVETDELNVVERASDLEALRHALITRLRQMTFPLLLPTDSQL
ncbi:MAG: deoxynucleoside kinase [Anaerolineales bacterium]|nr:deoxynucleoside kinase [Anaerolineales bacterium]MCB9128987.1 deoxynucleoside kinase [Ardenticatenales bacterium]